VQIARQWGLHPADADPRTQRPQRARWFWWQLEMDSLAAQLAPKG